MVFLFNILYVFSIKLMNFSQFIVLVSTLKIEINTTLTNSKKIDKLVMHHVFIGTSQQIVFISEITFQIKQLI